MACGAVRITGADAEKVELLRGRVFSRGRRSSAPAAASGRIGHKTFECGQKGRPILPAHRELSGEISPFEMKHDFKPAAIVHAFKQVLCCGRTRHVPGAVRRSTCASISEGACRKFSMETPLVKIGGGGQKQFTDLRSQLNSSSSKLLSPLLWKLRVVAVDASQRRGPRGYGKAHALSYRARMGRRLKIPTSKA